MAMDRNKYSSYISAPKYMMGGPSMDTASLMQLLQQQIAGSAPAVGGIGASVPFGPWNMGVLWVVVRGWGVGNAPATSGIALYGVVNELSRLALPLFAIIVLAASGELSGATDTGTAWTITIICAVAFVVVTALIVGIVRSERIASVTRGAAGPPTQAIAELAGPAANSSTSPLSRPL